jgi:formate dehydrogenase iron-sulfur subunit
LDRVHAESLPNGTIPDEAELTCGTRIEPGKSYGFFTDTTLCIGCKACEVACKEWNGLPACSKSCPTDSRAMIDRALNGEPPRRSG